MSRSSSIGALVVGSHRLSANRLFAASAAAVAACWSAAALGAVAPQVAPEVLEGRANALLGLRDSSVVSVEVDAGPAGGVAAFVEVDGLLNALVLDRHSVRSPKYQVLAQAEDGTLTPVEPGEVDTYRGSLEEWPGSAVAASLLADGLYARIFLPDGREFWLEPIATRVAGATASDYVLYTSEDVIGRGTCGAEAELHEGGGLDVPDLHHIDPDGGDSTIASFCTAELACDADYEYYSDYGSVSAVESRINSVINTMDLQYERDVNITHVITTIIVRSSEPDPYSSTDPNTLLNQFRNHWQANQGGVQRDVAHLFTGKNLNGGVIGIAWLRAVCGSYGYGLVESDFNGSFSYATDLSAHELGHNWGANHCSCPTYTMNPYITGRNRFDPATSIPEIVSFRDSRNCLTGCEDGGGLDVPLSDYVVFRGTQTGGNLASMDNSDDSYLTVNSTNGSTRRARVDVLADGAFGSVSSLDVEIETRASVTGVATRVYLYNFDTDGWAILDGFAQPTTDTVKTYSVTNPNRYVDNATGEIWVQIDMRKNGAPSFTMSIDHVKLTVSP